MKQIHLILPHYLDDFIMVHTSSAVCAYYMSTLQDICNFIGAPLSPDKMVGSVHIINFLGLTLNFQKQVVQIPLEKVQKAITQIHYLLSTQYVNNKNLKGKVQVKSIQKMTGLLNSICRVGPCRQPFLCRLYNLQAKAYSPHANASHPKTQTSSQGLPGQRFPARPTHVEAIPLQSHLSNPQRSQVPPTLSRQPRTTNICRCRWQCTSWFWVRLP